MFRVREVASVRTPGGEGTYVTPQRGDQYPADDPLVKAYPWMFEEEGVQREAEPTLRESVPIPAAPQPSIERGTRAPGERRPAVKKTAAPAKKAASGRGRTAGKPVSEGWGE